MKFEREIPIGLDARRKKWQGGAIKAPPPPNGIRVNDAFEVQFLSRLHFYTLPKTLIACRAMQLRFFKVKTLLNNAFKKWFA